MIQTKASGQPNKPARKVRRKFSGKLKQKAPWVLSAFVVLVVAAFAAQALGVSVFPTKEGASSAHSNDLHGVDVLPEVLDVPDAAIAATHVVDVVQTNVDESVADATGRIDASLAAAHANIQSIANLHGGLPEVPLGYVTGMDVSQYLDTVSSAAYNVPRFDATLEGTVEVAAAWTSMPSNIPVPEQLIPADATEVLGAIEGLDELEGILAQIEDELGTGSVLEELGLGDDPLAGLPVALPVGMFDPSDAESTVEPHEEGANAALQHATKVIDVAGSTFGGVEDDAEAALAQSIAMVGSVQATLNQLDQQAAQFEADISAEAQARVEATLAHADQLQADLQTAAAAYTAMLEQEALDAKESIDVLVVAQVDSVMEDVEEQVAQLDATIESVTADAEYRIEVVQSSTQGLLALHQGNGASYAELQAIVDESVQALADIEAETAADLDALNAVKAAIQAEAFATVDSIQSEATDLKADVDVLVAETVAETQSRLAFAVALADAQAGALVESHLAQAQLTVFRLENLLAEKQGQVVATAVGLSETGVDILGEAQVIISDAQTDAFTHVGTDLEYILSVAEDYSSVPVPDREKRAQYWGAVHGELTTGIGGTLGTADAALSTLSQAEAAMEANIAVLHSLI